MPIRFLGHSAFELTDGDVSVIVDPFLTGNPKAAVAAADVNPDVILLTHGHADHFGDTIKIAQRSGATVQAIDEIAREIAAHGITAIVPIGGHYTMDRHDAVTAVEWIGAAAVVPCHYNTAPAIETDVQAFAADVHAAGTAVVHVMQPGDTVTL
jgi:L-ascorbate metabolism protein UlaG (beta-lactamase superfamily)